MSKNSKNIIVLTKQLSPQELVLISEKLQTLHTLPEDLNLADAREAFSLVKKYNQALSGVMVDSGKLRGIIGQKIKNLQSSAETKKATDQPSLREVVESQSKLIQDLSEKLASIEDSKSTND
jgi:glycine cleavage system pyridoxal-binding protein P